MLNARDICLRAADLVGGDRAKTHGSKIQNHENIAALWRGYFRNMLRAGRTIEDLNALDVANLMELLKVARRQAGSHNADDYIDGAGYASVAGEIAEHTALADAAVKASGKSFSAVAADVAAKLDEARVRDAAANEGWSAKPIDDGADAPGGGLVESRDWCVFNTERGWWLASSGGVTHAPADAWRTSRESAQRVAATRGEFHVAQPAPPLPAAAA